MSKRVVMVLDRMEAKLLALRPRLEGNHPSLAIEEPITESEVQRIEAERGVLLPAEYCSFLLRFGDGRVGPHQFQRVREGLTDTSEREFPLSAPFLGVCSPAHQRLPPEAQMGEYKRLVAQWDAIPRSNGVSVICHYGCGIYAVLILNGRFRGKVWLYSQDAAYYGPFGGAEALHDEAAVAWEPTENPRDYSFFEWYEHWLDSQLRLTELVAD
jgi:hypothetical protein